MSIFTHLMTLIENATPENIAEFKQTVQDNSNNAEFDIGGVREEGTLLHYAVKKHNKDNNNVIPIIQFLLEETDIDIAKEFDGRTALQLAEELNSGDSHTPVVILLRNTPKRKLDHHAVVEDSEIDQILQEKLRVQDEERKAALAATVAAALATVNDPPPLQPTNSLQETLAAQKAGYNANLRAAFTASDDSAADSEVKPTEEKPANTKRPHDDQTDDLILQMTKKAKAALKSNSDDNSQNKASTTEPSQSADSNPQAAKFKTESDAEYNATLAAERAEYDEARDFYKQLVSKKDKLNREIKDPTISPSKRKIKEKKLNFLDSIIQQFGSKDNHETFANIVYAKVEALAPEEKTAVMSGTFSHETKNLVNEILKFSMDKKMREMIVHYEKVNTKLSEHFQKTGRHLEAERVKIAYFYGNKSSLFEKYNDFLPEEKTVEKVNTQITASYNSLDDADKKQLKKGLLGGGLFKSYAEELMKSVAKLNSEVIKRNSR